MQQYIHNPVLYEKHKIELRIYFTIVSTNPVIVYYTKAPVLRMCADEYDPMSSEKYIHVCNMAISTQKSYDYIVDFDLYDLQNYLIKKGVITDENWADQVIYP